MSPSFTKNIDSVEVSNEVVHRLVAQLAIICEIGQMDEIEGKEIEEKKGDITSVKNSGSETAIEYVYGEPPLTFKRIIVLISLTSLWLSGTAPIFLITASFCNQPK